VTLVSLRLAVLKGQQGARMARQVG